MADVRRQLEEQLAQQLDLLEDSLNNPSKVGVLASHLGFSLNACSRLEPKRQDIPALLPQVYQSNRDVSRWRN